MFPAVGSRLWDRAAARSFLPKAKMKITELKYCLWQNFN
jgi:hypothetical protein